MTQDQFGCTSWIDLRSIDNEVIVSPEMNRSHLRSRQSRFTIRALRFALLHYVKRTFDADEIHEFVTEIQFKISPRIGRQDMVENNILTVPRVRGRSSVDRVAQSRNTEWPFIALIG